MKLRSYLAADVLAHTAAVSFVLLAIILTGRFVKYLAEAASGKLAAEILIPVMVFRLPGFIELLLPLGLFIGILMAYGRLYVESEMVILSATGVGPWQLARFTLLPALFIMALVAGLSLYLTPLGAARSETMLNDPRAMQGLQLLAAGRFQPQGDDGTVTYAAAVDPEMGKLQQVFLYSPEDTSATIPASSITVAREGQVVRDDDSGRRYLELREGYRFTGKPGKQAFRVVQFGRYGELLPEDPDLGRREPVDAKPTRDLWVSTDIEDKAALHWRLSLVLMVPVVALLALSLSKTNHRRGRYVKLAPALLLHLSYLLLLASGRTRLAEGEVSIAQFWSIHGAFAMLALLLLFGGGVWQRVRRR